MPISVSAIYRYPVKSCRGHAVDDILVEPWGLAGDRRWMIVDEQGDVITAREVNQLLLVEPHPVADGLELTAPDLPPCLVPVPDAGALETVDVWGSRIEATPAGDEADAWFTKVVGRTARLVYLDDPTRRPTNPLRTYPDDRVSFADGYPLLLASEGSLAALNENIADGPRAGEGPLPMMRFRPNVVVRGAEAWAEDDWRRIRIGEVEFRLVKGCDRCVMTTLDPVTAARGKEPIASLARHRRWDGKTWFAVNLVPDTQGKNLRVGDEVEVLSAVDPGDGPLR